MSRILEALRSLGIDPQKFFQKGDDRTTMDQTKGLPTHPIKGRDGNTGGVKIGKPLDPNRSQRNDETP